MARSNSRRRALQARNDRCLTWSGVRRSASAGSEDAPWAGATARGACAPSAAPSNAKFEEGSTNESARAAARRAKRATGASPRPATSTQNGPGPPSCAASRNVAHRRARAPGGGGLDATNPASSPPPAASSRRKPKETRSVRSGVNRRAVRLTAAASAASRDGPPCSTSTLGASEP